MIAIIDYDVGNLFSLSASLTHLEIPHVVSKKKEEIQGATHIILPGVGAFGDAAKLLFDSGLAEVVCDEAEKKPLLGICVGMQLLFEKGFEFGEHRGLGLLEGEVHPIKDGLTEPLKVPHMGWNNLSFQKESKLFTHISEGSHVYFVHSYSAKTPEHYISSTAEYGGKITASVEKGHVYGTQFHPEKSGEVGLNLLKAFYEIK